MKLKGFLFIFCLITHSGMALGHGSEPEAPLDQKTILDAFSEDLRTGKFPSIEGAAFRQSNHRPMELRVTERIYDQQKFRVVHCLGCRDITGGTQAQLDEQKRIAKISDVQYFLDLYYDEVDLELALVRVQDNRIIWKKTYSAHPKSIEPILFKLQISAGFAPRVLNENRFNLGLGAQAEYRGFGLETNFYRWLHQPSTFAINVLLLKFLRLQDQTQIWAGAGLRYTDSSLKDSLNPELRLGLEWSLTQSLMLSPYAGAVLGSEVSGLSTGLHLGYRL